MTETAPLCVVLMPSGKKSGPLGTMIDFDAVFDRVVAPAVDEAGLHALRLERETTGIVDRVAFERLVLSEFAIADVSTQEFLIGYELGVRTGARPAATVLIVAEGLRLPIDAGSIDVVRYRLDDDGRPVRPDHDRATLAEVLRRSRPSGGASPFFDLVDEVGPADVSRLKTDVFRDRVEYSELLKKGLHAARSSGLDALIAFREGLGSLDDLEGGVVIDLFLSFRAVKGWTEMIDLVPKMAPTLRRTPLVREQQAFALNRVGRGGEAEQILLDLIADRGPSSETYGLLGRVYKDRWDQARRAGDEDAAAILDKAIEAYLAGFEADWRDAYPGINAVTLMSLRDPPDPRAEELLPVVRYSVGRRMAAGEPDYWDHATLLELAIMAGSESRARAALADALASVREVWEPEATLGTLRLARAIRTQRGERIEPWVEEIELALARAAEA